MHLGIYLLVFLAATSSADPKINTTGGKSNNIKISNCVHIYFISTSPVLNDTTVRGNCAHYDIDSLNVILQDQHLEVSINQNCIVNNASITTSHSVTLTLSIGDTNISDSLLHDYIERNNGRQVLEPEDFQQNNRNQTLFISSLANDTALGSFSEVRTLLETLRDIQTIILNSMDLGSLGSKVHNLSTDFLNTSFDKDILIVQEIKDYLTELEMEVQSVKHLNTLLRLQNLTALLGIPWVQCLLNTERWECEVNAERVRYQQVLDKFLKVRALKVFKRYVDPIVYSVILSVGLIWNGVLLLIFAREKQMWTHANIMIFNLAVADILSLVLNLLFFYFAHYHFPYLQMSEYTCKFYTTIRPLSVALSALSVVTLSILRYVATGQSFTIYSKQEVCNLSERARTILYILIVWFLALLLALPYSFVIMFSKGKCFRYGDGEVAKIVTLFEFLFYCGLLPSIVIVFNSLTANGLKQSTRDMTVSLKANGHDLVRNRSAKVLMALVIVFLISYVPHYLWRVLHRWLSLDIWEVSYRCVDKITYYLLFANCCFNPISLYIVSGTFRKMFNHYFFYAYYKHCNENHKIQVEKLQSTSSITMNAVRSRF